MIRLKEPKTPPQHWPHSASRDLDYRVFRLVGDVPDLGRSLHAAVRSPTDALRYAVWDRHCDLLDRPGARPD